MFYFVLPDRYFVGYRIQTGYYYFDLSRVEAGRGAVCGLCQDCFSHLHQGYVNFKLVFLFRILL